MIALASKPPITNRREQRLLMSFSNKLLLCSQKPARTQSPEPFGRKSPFSGYRKIIYEKKDD